MSLSFEDAAAKIKTLKTAPSDTEKLELYGLFKQGTNDPAFENATKPGMFDLTGKAKYGAWKKVADAKVTPEDAKTQYIALVEKLVEKYGVN